MTTWHISDPNPTPLLVANVVPPLHNPSPSGTVGGDIDVWSVTAWILVEERLREGVGRGWSVGDATLSIPPGSGTNIVKQYIHSSPTSWCKIVVEYFFLFNMYIVVRHWIIRTFSITTLACWVLTCSIAKTDLPAALLVPCTIFCIYI